MSAPRRSKRAYNGGIIYPQLRKWVTCDYCGKRGYHVRNDAKRIAKLMAMANGEKASAIGVYPCGDLYHVGHNTPRTEAP